MPDSSDLTITRADVAMLSAIWANAQQATEHVSEALGQAPDLATRDRLAAAAEHAADATEAASQLLDRLTAQIYVHDLVRDALAASGS